MAQAIYSIEQYVATIRKKDTIWMVFNTEYNRVHALKQEPYVDEMGCHSKYLNNDYTNYDKQKEFLDFMSNNFPDIKIVKVFDLVTNYIQYQYLGSYAIDIDLNGDVYEAINEKYGTPQTEDEQVNAELWYMTYEDSKKFHQDKIDLIGI